MPCRQDRSSYAALSIALLSSVAASPVLAQDAPGGAAATASRSDDDIVVTAQRREERLIDVPISVSALNEGKLVTAGVTNVGNIGTVIPNIQINQTVGNTWSPLISIRGLAPSSDTSLGRDQPVGIYVDGVPVAKSTGAAFDSVDLQRIEVLRGPQGTLYGKNTIGGAINLVSKKPSGEFGGQLVLGGGSYDTYHERLVVDLPAIGMGSGAIKIKLGVAGRQGNSWTKQTGPSRGFSETDMAAARADVLWEASDRFSVAYAYDITDHNGTGVPLAISAPGMIGPGGALAAYYPLIQNRIVTNGRPRTLATDFTGRSDFSVAGHAVTATFDATDTITFKTITAWRKLITRSLSDFDGTPVDLQHFILNNNYNQFSQEVQAIGTFDDFRFTVGGFYMRDRYDVYNPRWSLRFGNLAKYDLSDRSGRNRSLAAYGQFTWSPAALDHRLEVTGGLRWTRDTKRTRNLFLAYNTYAANPANPLSGVFVRDVNGNPVLTNGGAPLTALPDSPGGIGPYGLTGLEAERSWSKLTPEANISYKIQPDWTIYARFATGFKSGGFNDVAANNSAFLTPFNPENLKSYEIGTKGVFGDGLLSLNLAAYRSDYTDFQAGVFVPTLITTNVINADKARFQGFEVEGTLRPIPELSVNFGYGYTDAKYLKFILPSGADVTNTYKVPLVPKENWQLGGTATLPLGQELNVSANLNYSWRSSQVSSLAPDPTTDRKAYGLLDGRLALGGIRLGPNQTMEVALWAKNITDTQYVTSAINLSLYTLRQWGDPRTWGVETRLRF